MQAIIILNIITKIIMLMVMRLGIEKTVQDPRLDMYPLLQGVGEEGAVHQNMIRLLPLQDQGNIAAAV